MRSSGSDQDVARENKARSAKDEVIVAKALSKRYGTVQALDDVSLGVAGGRILALLGANGAGKTTTVHLLLGLLTPSAGAAKIAGHDVAADPVRARRASAYVPDRLALYPHLTGLENLTYFHRAGAETERSASELADALRRVGLDGDAQKRRASTYSKGMCQKVGLAIALAKGARALLLDEPLSGLDPKAANEFCALLRELADGGAAILMATHDLFRAHELADEIGIMRDGRLVERLRSQDVDAGALEKLYLERMR